MNQKVESVLNSVKESIVMALVALRTNKLRSILTLLGVAVGVFSIIGIMTAMSALQNSIESGMSALGVNTVQVQKYPMFETNDPEDMPKYRNRRDITYEQAARVRDNAEMAKAIGIFCATFGKVVKSEHGEKTNPNVSLSGRNVEGFTANSWTISNGRIFTQTEVSSAQAVVVLGFDVAKKCFPRTDPINQLVRIDGHEFRVIGVKDSKGGMMGGGDDNIAVIPITTYFNMYGRDQNVNIKVQATDRTAFEDCVEQVRNILRAIRHVPPGEEDDFYIWSNDSMIAQFNDFTKYVRIGIMVISGIALLAAGVGIMNIMLVSVTERTREIGIRKALGARKSNILSQFVLEAVIISELGGIIGVTVGLIGGNMLAMLMEIPAVIPYNWVLIGFGSCTLIGVIFGVYPAWKAANLDPIESLRYE
ncbi:MAG TPA: ABC transporter permease [Bacteroidota bacterium]|jgi:putative ABC transport system permease protein|nr:ABC transporter permease [Bacteroidota bacterium]